MAEPTTGSKYSQVAVERRRILSLVDLWKYMSCRGSCLATVGSDQPAEFVDDPPKDLNPGACLYTQQVSISLCDGSHRRMRRLCPCA
ncbi:hypothetical protein MLD38_035714 [Melastoma candidum]|uniref:Uncharacterized protein n=1 Tax=Melastoma candidum TaxID=119954 RepID=A0ACB9LIE1_9MYRT|nr:hypothetical protein MLD38_035714 [Melastoma candidum]